MTLDDYLNQPDAMSATDLARLLGLNPDQVRQWRHQHAGRRPSPENCVAIEQATKGAVSRRDLRPDDWERIWPELKAVAGRGAERPTQGDIDRVMHSATRPPGREGPSNARGER